MANHRSERRRWWRRDRIGELTALPTIFNTARMTGDQTVAIWSVPVTVARAHPWRDVPCLVCRQPADEGPVILVVFAGGMVKATGYHRAGTAGYLVHAYHEQFGDDDLYQMAHRLESPGCPCNSPAAVVGGPYEHADRSAEWLR